MKIFLLSILLFFVTDISAQSADIDFSFVGQNIPKKVYYQKLEPMSFLDSVDVEKNNHIHLDVDEYQSFRFIVNGQKLFMIIQPDEQVNITFDTDDLLNSKIANSRISEEIFEGLRIVRDSDSAHLKLNLKKFINSHPQSLSNIVFIEYFDFDKDFKFVDVINNNLRYQIPAVQDLHNRVEAHRCRMKGAKIQDFKIPEVQSGRVVSPSEFLGKEYSIIFFAACNKLSVNVTKDYFQKNPNRKILAVMLDGDRDLVSSTIKDLDNPNAVYCSEMKYFDSDLAKHYYVTKLPLIIEVSSKGTVIQSFEK